MSGDETIRDPNASEENNSSSSARRFGKYVTLHEIGRGGFGSVWLALDSELGRNVALKVLRGQEEFSTSFLSPPSWSFS